MLNVQYFYHTQLALHTVIMALMACSLLVVSDDPNLEFQFPPSWCVLLHHEDTTENLSPPEPVVLLQGDLGLLPVCGAAWTCRETHLENNCFFMALGSH